MNSVENPVPGNVPRRLLILDRDPGDPKWILATVSIPTDVRPAVLDAAGRCQDWQQAAAWVAAMFPGPVALVPIHDALAWRVDEGLPR